MGASLVWRFRLRCLRVDLVGPLGAGQGYRRLSISVPSTEPIPP